MTLRISGQVVKNRTSSVLRELAANDRTQAVVNAIRTGWPTLDDVGSVAS